MGKANFDATVMSKTLKIFKFELDVHDYVPEQIFISIRSAGAYPQMMKYYGFVTFSWLVDYTLFIIGHATRSNPWMDFHGYGS